MDEPEEGVSFTKRDEPSPDPAGEAEFDPYRFGKPEHPIPAEYAPPGYTGPTIPAAAANPYASATGNPYASPTDNPFANPPGTPYGGSAPGAPYGPPYEPPPYGSPPYGGAPYGGPPYGGPPYGYGYDPSAPPPPPFHGYPQPRTGNGKAIAGLVLGILSIVLCLLSIFDLLLLIPALVFSLIALGETKNGQGSGRGLAIAGLVCTIIGALLATLMTVFYVRVSDKCGDLQDQRSEFQHCIRHEVL